jgi:hypothetical protein
MSSIVVRDIDDLKKVAKHGVHGGWLLNENANFTLDGNIVLTEQLKTVCSTVVNGAPGSSITFKGKGCISASQSARRIVFNNIVLRAEEKALFGIGANTARCLTLNDVVIDAADLGSCHTPNILLSNVSVLNELTLPLVLGNYVDTLVINGLRHDAVEPLLDICRSNLEGSAILSDIILKHPKSGIMLLNDLMGGETQSQGTNKRYRIEKHSILLKNIQGLTNALNVFRQRGTDGTIESVSAYITNQYVI